MYSASRLDTPIDFPNGSSRPSSPAVLLLFHFLTLVRELRDQNPQHVRLRFDDGLEVRDLPAELRLVLRKLPVRQVAAARQALAEWVCSR